LQEVPEHRGDLQRRSSPAAAPTSPRRTEAAEARRDEVANDMTTRWARLRTDLRNQIDQLHDPLWRSAVTSTTPRWRQADPTEDNAVAAIDFAQSAIDAAGEATLEAIDARAQAEAIAPAAEVRASAQPRSPPPPEKADAQ
jgi:hypothetical protein